MQNNFIQLRKIPIQLLGFKKLKKVKNRVKPLMFEHFSEQCKCGGKIFFENDFHQFSKIRNEFKCLGTNLNVRIKMQDYLVFSRYKFI